MTTYVVLQKDGPGWAELGRVEAINDAAAIKQSLDGEQTGEFVAVPERSFRPRKAVAKTVIAFEV